MARRSLLTLRSNLRELKYSSPKRQPYIYTPLPAYNESGPNVYMGPDLMGRNGRSFAAEQDFTRISRFFSDKSNAAGLFFATKQNALEKTSPKTPYGPARVYNPANTLAQVAVSGTGVHFDKNGLTPDLSGRQKYGRKTIESLNFDSTNRLTLLYQSKIAGESVKKGGFNIAKNENTLIRYGGGPNSLGGIGFTTLRRYTNTVNWHKESASTEVGSFRNNNKAIALIPGQLFKKERSNSTGFGSTGGKSISNFMLELNGEPFKEENKKRILGRITSYNDFNRNKTFGTGDPGNIPNFDRQAYYKNKPSKTNGTDKINLQKIYSSTSDSTPPELQDDMIKFFIAVINNDDPSQREYIQFRAYLSGFDDQYSADWSSLKYLGRGENFYKYSGFDRTIGFNFSVHIGSRIELFNVHKKLNYLASLVAPDYSSTGFMRGNIIELTIGDYLNKVPGVITGFTLDIPDESVWEIARNDDGSVDKENAGELPTLINVTGFQFKPIHNFVPQKVKNFDDPASKFISLGADAKGYKFESTDIK